MTPVDRPPLAPRKEQHREQNDEEQLARQGEEPQWVLHRIVVVGEPVEQLVGLEVDGDSLRTRMLPDEGRRHGADLAIEIPDAVRRRVVEQFPRLGFKREFAALWRAEAKQVPRGRAWYLHRFAVTDLSIRMAPFG
jgi:hypothetical protein